ncbi:MAG: hypothetical protein Kow0013_12410 [Pararhodobacter sp.]
MADQAVGTDVIGDGLARIIADKDVDHGQCSSVCKSESDICIGMRGAALIPIKSVAPRAGGAIGVFRETVVPAPVAKLATFPGLAPGFARAGDTHRPDVPILAPGRG